MAKGVFVTGTDTGVGKTVACGLLMDRLVAQGNVVAAMKPVASGAKNNDGILRNDDAVQLMQHTNLDIDYDLINPYCFEPAIAPHIAAWQADTEIEMEVIRQAYDQLSRRADWIIVEGIGGWSVPINDVERVADIPVSLSLPVILIVGMKLGCLNHALLTADAIRAKGARLVGWIANRIDPEMGAFDENIQTLKVALDCPLLSVIPNMDQGQNDLNQNISINIDILES